MYIACANAILELNFHTRMRKLLFITYLLFTIQLGASEPLKIGVITDIHYLSEQLMDNGYAINSYVYENGKNVIAAPEVLDKVVSDYLNSDINVLFISGDLTKNGEKLSHIDFREKLRPLYDKGVKIFVLPGNHDINIPNPLRYQGNKTFKTENINSEDFANIYADYGYKNAISEDSNSLSYLAELDESTWLLALDVARYQEYKDRPISSGKLKSETEVWMLAILQKAKEQNKQVIAMMHWGIVEHIPFQNRFFPNYLVDDNKRIASLLADNGVKIVFTGHFHSNDITEYVSEKGNQIYDIETGALASYPFSYRLLELSNEQLKIETRNITATENHPNLVAENKEILKRIATARALPMIEKLEIPFPKNKHNQLAEIASDIFLLHLYGDEKVSEDTKTKLVNIFVEMGFPVDDNLNDLNIDFPPVDNNVILELK